VARLIGLERADWPALEALAHAASTDDTATEDRAALRARLLGSSARRSRSRPRARPSVSPHPRSAAAAGSSCGLTPHVT
jgi:hypothetical protein